jgi:hypothetical protein
MSAIVCAIPTASQSLFVGVIIRPGFGSHQQVNWISQHEWAKESKDQTSTKTNQTWNHNTKGLIEKFVNKKDACREISTNTPHKNTSNLDSESTKEIPSLMIGTVIIVKINSNPLMAISDVVVIIDSGLCSAYASVVIVDDVVVAVGVWHTTMVPMAIVVARY